MNKLVALGLVLVMLGGFAVSALPTATASTPGYLGRYYNFPQSHPDLETTITGIDTGYVKSSLPLTLTAYGGTKINQFDWFSDAYFAFSRVDANLMFGSSWFPVDEGLPYPSDPYYFAVHWKAVITVASEGNYNYEMRSDDDSWLFIDGQLEMDLGGIHPIGSLTAGSVHLTAGSHDLDIYFAERHVVQSGFEFRFTSQGVTVETPDNAINVPEFEFGAVLAAALGFSVMMLVWRRHGLNSITSR